MCVFDNIGGILLLAHEAPSTKHSANATSGRLKGRSSTRTDVYVGVNQSSTYLRLVLLTVQIPDMDLH